MGVFFIQFGSFEPENIFNEIPDAVVVNPIYFLQDEFIDILSLHNDMVFL
jgi:hypothetical protein